MNIVEVMADIEVQRILELISKAQPGTKEYDALLVSLDKQIELISKTKKETKFEKFWSNGPAVTGSFGLVSLVIILWFERFGVITTKAFSKIRW